MLGYKGMDENMTCRGMKFEVGKTYHVKGKIELCKNGLHFCKKLIDVFRYYENNGYNRYFIVEANEQMIESDDKCVASSLKIIRELTLVEVNRAYYSSEVYDYKNNIGNGYGYGDGFGSGGGYGDGFGSGNGYGGGNGDGFALGNGYGDGFGSGNGYGGYGYGDNDGNGGYMRKSYWLNEIIFFFN